MTAPLNMEKPGCCTRLSRWPVAAGFVTANVAQVFFQVHVLLVVRRPPSLLYADSFIYSSTIES